MKLLKFFFIILQILPLATCSQYKIESLYEKEPYLKSEGTYTAYLALEYLHFSKILAAEGNKSMSRHFVEKGMFAADGTIPAPESPLDWDVDNAQLEEMVSMQKRLEEILSDSYMVQYLPIQLAHLTYLYDCWISRESSEQFRLDDLARCRTKFSRLVDELERYLDSLTKDRVAGVKIKEPEFRRFEVVFDLNSFKFNDSANREVISIMKYLKTLNGDFHILLVGNADRSGPEVYNQSLALARGDIVRNALTKNGVFANTIEMRAVGEDFPDIISEDGVRNMANRVVRVYVVRGAVSFSSIPLPLIDNQIYREEVVKARRERGL